jgi:UDP-N-acetylmuramoylalanine--D-glutamate ligase
LNIFLNKKILIYGLGKSGLSAFNFFKNKSDIFLYDDYQSKFKSLEVQKRFIDYKKVLKKNFDQIILSPGIDINKCKLSNFLKKNYFKIYSDLDVFYSFFKNDCITITGTNGKSTTCQLMYEVLLKQKFDVRLVGNIGNPILSIKKVKKKQFLLLKLPLTN